MLDRIEQLCTGISRFLSDRVEEGIDDYRVFYGTSFSLLYFKMRNELSPSLSEKLIRLIDSADRSDPEFHWEFCNYALLHYEALGGVGISPLIEDLHFKGTPCTNWSLLRACSKLLGQTDDAYLEVAKVMALLRKNQLPSGLITDDLGVNSFQYHCFSASLCAEIYELTDDPEFLDRFEYAVDFIRNFILPNGDTLYIGRGQEQSFGYGTLIFILSKWYAYSSDATVLSDIDSVLKFVEEKVRKDGSLPLIFNGVEREIPKVVNMNDPQFVGWYPYNNFYDYLPFLAVYLERTRQILSKCDLSKFASSQQQDFIDSQFMKVVMPNYISVVGKPGGYWSNDLNLPYIYSFKKRRAITPFFGGEQFQHSLYHYGSLPLPTWKKFSFRRKLKSIRYKNTFICFSLFGIYISHYQYFDERVRVRDLVLSPFPFKSNFLFHKGQRILSKSPLLPLGHEYSGAGELERFRGGRINQIDYMVS